MSDEQFAKAWVQSRRKSKKKGKIALKAELYQKGIDKEIIDEILDETTPESEEQLAQEALEKKMKVWENLPSLDLKKKAYEFLMRRGFEYEIVRQVTENLIKRR